MKVEIKQRTVPYEFKLPNGRVLCHVEEAVLSHERFDGKMSRDITRFNFDRGDGVGVLLYADSTDEVVLVEQFRYPAYASDPENGWLLEIVAGIKDGEGSHVARRELLEETGYKLTGSLERLTTFYVSPGGTSERIELFLAHVQEAGDIHESAGLDHESEDIRPHVLPFPQALGMIPRGRIVDAKTIIALYMLKERLGR